MRLWERHTRAAISITLRTTLCQLCLSNVPSLSLLSHAGCPYPKMATPMRRRCGRVKIAQSLQRYLSNNAGMPLLPSEYHKSFHSTFHPAMPLPSKPHALRIGGSPPPRPSSLQQDSKPKRQRRTQQGRPTATAHLHHNSSPILLPLLPCKPRMHNLPPTRRSARPSTRTRRRNIHPDRALRATGVLLAAVALALRVRGAAVERALVRPLLADEEGEGLAVLGQVGGAAVGADAGVG